LCSFQKEGREATLKKIIVIRIGHEFIDIQKGARRPGHEAAASHSFGEASTYSISASLRAEP